MHHLGLVIEVINLRSPLRPLGYVARPSAVREGLILPKRQVVGKEVLYRKPRMVPEHRMVDKIRGLREPHDWTVGGNQLQGVFQRGEEVLDQGILLPSVDQGVRARHELVDDPAVPTPFCPGELLGVEVETGGAKVQNWFGENYQIFLIFFQKNNQFFLLESIICLLDLPMGNT